MNQHPTWNQEERTTMQLQSKPGHLTDLHQRGSADATGLRERYRTLQTSCPVLYDQKAGSWLVLRCSDVESLLTDPESFASSTAHSTWRCKRCCARRWDVWPVSLARSCTQPSPPCSNVG